MSVAEFASSDGASSKLAEDSFFSFLGRYVAFLQEAENQIDEIIRVDRGFAGRDETSAQLSKMRLAAKINTLWYLNAPSKALSGSSDVSNWARHTQALVERLHIARKRRNSLVHSYYLYEFTESGYPVMRANIRLSEGELVHQYEDLGEQVIKADLESLAQLVFDVGQYKVQVIHWQKS